MIAPFFKTRKNKSFNFKPRYYNENREELEKRYAQIAAELNKEATSNNPHFRGNLKEQWKSNKNTSNFSKKSNFRLLVIFALLCMIAYYLFYL